jgi:hypothetical protein
MLVLFRLHPVSDAVTSQPAISKIFLSLEEEEEVRLFTPKKKKLILFPHPLPK